MPGLRQSPAGRGIGGRGPAQRPAHPGNWPDSGRLRQIGSLHPGGSTNQDGAAGCFELPIRGDDDFYFTAGSNDRYSDSSGTDEIYLPSGFTSGATVYWRFGNDLKIVLDASNSIYIPGHYSGGAIETLKFDGGTNINLTTVSTITQGADTNDTVNGNTSVADTLYGGGGNDVLNGYSGNDTLYGGAGNDTINASSGDDHLYGDAGDDTLDGSSGVDTFYYISGHDVIEDTNTGDDVLKLLYGWTMEDLAFRRYYNVDTNDVIVEISSANSITLTNQVASGTYLATLQFADNSTMAFSDIQVTTYGGGGSGTITGISNGASIDEIIYGEGGNDVINAGTGDDIVYGGDDADTISGGDGNDIAYGDGGNDVLYGNAGNDTLDGGVGDDSLYGQTGDDVLIYSGGLDTIGDLYSSSAGGSDTLLITGGTTINDISFSNVSTYDTKITITASTDEITVTYLRHGSSTYHIETVAFDDGFSANLPSYASWTNGTSGTDTLTGTSGADTIIGKDDTDTLDGASGNDAVHGGSGNDVVKGGSGSDLLHGGEGDDFLWGEDGLDTMWGGAGEDIFVFEAVNAYNDIDVIKDFSLGDGDIIDINNLLTAYDPMYDDLADFVLIEDSGADSTLKVDRDGTGGTYGFVQIATLEGITGLTDEDALVSSGNLLVA